MKVKFILIISALFYTSLIGQGNCLNFTSSLDKVVINSPVSGTDNFTLEAWFFSNNISAGTEIGRLFNWDGPGTSRFEPGDVNGNFVVYVFGGGGGSSFYNSGVNIRDGNWHHMAITRENNDFMVYVDGTLTNSFSRSLTMYSGLHVGHYDDSNSFNSQWIGSIDEIRIWEYPMTQAEIQAIKNCELVGDEPCLVGYWNFNQGTAGGNNSGETTLDDLHSNSNDGTLTNFTLSGSTSNWVASGAGVSGNCSNVVCSALPVELMDFKGALGNDRINLIWKTASELNNSGFEIQKSKNGRDWQIIDFVEGQGTTTEFNEYQYEDLNPFSGINYYRLKQIDFDGAFEFSKVIAVEYDNSERSINVFPNPSNGLINLQIDNPSSQRMKIKISDNLGRKIWESELVEGESNWRKEIEIIGNGIYFVTAQIGNEIFYERAVITNEK